MTARLALLFFLLLGRPVAAFEAEPTHAAMTGAAVLASPLDETLRRWGRERGVWNDVTLSFGGTPRVEAARLRERLAAIDPGAGYAPGDDGVMRAGGWVVAGAVIEDVPATRARHHFLDPARGAGLDDARAGSAFLMTLLGAMDAGGSLAGLFTGTNFDETGEPADRWIGSRENEQSVPEALRRLRLQATAPTPRERDAHLARALLALGGAVHVLQDMASPSRVRNDYRAAHLARAGASVFDRASAFERWVALARGSTAPDPGPPGPPRAHARDFFRAADGLGLADFTARHFFSPGTLPRSVAVTPGMGLFEIARRANGGLARPLPRVTRLDRHRGHARGLVPHLVRHGVDPQGRMRFALDSACHADYAAALVAEAVRSTRDFLAFVLRGRIEVALGGGRATLTNRGAALGGGRVEILWEDVAGTRRLLAAFTAGAVATGAPITTPPVAVPATARRAVVVFDGRDARGEPIVIVETAVR